MLCYPIEALGSVTINGAPITRGETIQAYGELRVDVGTFRVYDISVWNNNQQWSPVSVEGSVLVFNVQSNGEFFIYDNRRNILFSFVNDMQADFSIDKIKLESTGQVKAEGTYYQTQSFGPGSANYRIEAFSDVSSLEVSATNLIVGIVSRPTNNSVVISVNSRGMVTDSPGYVRLGNTLVMYIENVLG